MPLLSVIEASYGINEKYSLPWPYTQFESHWISTHFESYRILCSWDVTAPQSVCVWDNAGKVDLYRVNTQKEAGIIAIIIIKTIEVEICLLSDVL